MATSVNDEELQEPLILSETEKAKPERNVGALSRTWRRALGLSLVVFAAVAMTCGLWQHCGHDLGKFHPHHKHHHAHVSYQAVLKENNEIEYSREFSVPCGYGILVFNIGPALDYEPFQYDVYQDAYVYSNNQNLCWVYPSYRGIQRGPFPFWVQGDATALDVPVGKSMNKISSRIVRPAHAKDLPASRGGDFLMVAKGNFYTPAFYKSLLSMVQSWKDNHENMLEDLASLMEDLTLEVDLDKVELGGLELLP